MFSKIVSSVSSALDFNLATLSGCIDILVVPKENGDLQSTPFHVRFGKAKLLRSREKIVTVSVNWQPTDLRMQLGAAGEAYFLVEESESEDLRSSDDDSSDREKESVSSNTEGHLSTYENGRNTTATAAGGGSSVIPEVVSERSRGPMVADDQPSSSVRLGGYRRESTEGLTRAVTVEGKSAVKPPPSIAVTSSEIIVDGNQLISTPPRVELSLCGHLLYGTQEEAFHDRDVFQANLTTWETLDADPSLWYHPSLVARFDQRQPYFPAKAVFPLVMSWVVFQKPLGPQALQALLTCSLEADVAKPNIAPQPASESADIKISKPARRRSKSVTSREGHRSTRRVTISPHEQHHSSSLVPSTAVSPAGKKLYYLCCSLSQTGADTDLETRFGKVDEESKNEAVSKSNVLQLMPPNDEGYPPTSSASAWSVSPTLVEGSTGKVHINGRTIRYRKSLRPTSSQLMSLGLKPGPNSITFSVSSALQGTKTVTGTIYLWPRNSKIVVSDVDGTITRSDLWGQLMPIVGRDWSHAGVAELFSNIRNNGYRILYLTARAIGQADSTRDYLFGLTQNEKNKLPDGPLVLSPDRLFPSFKREVIDRKPYVFKIAALRDIRNLFPPFYNPFYAGFGNRESDHRAYVHIGVPEAKIFIIDPLGVVHHVNSTYAKSYESMTSISAEMFPAIREDLSSQPLDEQVKLTMREDAIREIKRTLLRSKAALDPPEGVFSPPVAAVRQLPRTRKSRSCCGKDVPVDMGLSPSQYEITVDQPTTAPGYPTTDETSGFDTGDSVSPPLQAALVERQRNFLVPLHGLDSFKSAVVAVSGESSLEEDVVRSQWPLRKNMSQIVFSGTSPYNSQSANYNNPPKVPEEVPLLRVTPTMDSSEDSFVYQHYQYYNVPRAPRPKGTVSTRDTSNRDSSRIELTTRRSGRPTVVATGRSPSRRRRKLVIDSQRR